LRLSAILKYATTAAGFFMTLFVTVIEGRESYRKKRRGCAPALRARDRDIVPDAGRVHLSRSMSDAVFLVGDVMTS
jgi:hypothetical protein